MKGLSLRHVMQATQPRFLSTDAQYPIRGKMNAADYFEMEWIAPSAASGVWDCAGFSARFAGEPKDTCISRFGTNIEARQGLLREWSNPKSRYDTSNFNLIVFFTLQGNLLVFFIEACH
jgi:hypothetical protein